MSARLRSWFRSVAPLPGANRSVAEQTDGELVTTFTATHDDEAFAELVRRHGPMVLAACRRVLYPDSHTADDAFQATFLVLATKAGAVSPPERIGAWLHGVAVHVAKRAKAWVRKLVPSAPSDLDKVPAAFTESDPDAAQLRSTIDEVLAGLPAKYRSPVVLCDLEGKSRAEAATVLGWSEGTLSGRLARARNLLADRLARRGVALPAAGLAVVLLTQPAAASVPAHLAASTVEAAAMVAAGAAAAEVASGPVAALTRGGCESMTATTFKFLAAGVAGIGLALAGFGLFATQAADPVKPAPVPLPVFAVAERPAEPKGWVNVHTLKFKAGLGTVAFGEDFVVAGDQEGLLAVHDLKTGKEREKILDGTDGGGAKPIDIVRVSADGKWLLLVTNDGDGLHGCTVEKKDRKFPGFGGGANMKFRGFTTDGSHILQLMGGGKEAVLMENKLPAGMIGGFAAARFAHEEAVEFAVADDTATVATLTSPRLKPVLRLWTKGKDKPVWEVKLADLANIDVTGIAVAPGGTLVAVIGDAGQVWIFDAKTGKRVAKADKLTGPAGTAAFSPDGKQIAVGCDDKTARVIDTETGKELAVLKGHTEAVTCIAFSADGDMLATGSDDKTVKVWKFEK